ncbi:MAG: IS110 family transposase [Peptococcaceae bacterium]|nr:IS110 family transposase [Peptococcaceae bacterium]
MKEFIPSTLYVGPDVSARQNILCALSFSGDKLLIIKESNDDPGTENIAAQLKRCLLDNNLDRVTIALESTSFYSVHIANYLSACDELMPFHPMVYCLNPKTTARYKETFVDMDKTDPLDALAIADFARAQKITTESWRGTRFLSLQRLTRYRLHIVDSIAREKVYMLDDIYLKFSELAVINNPAERPFSNRYSVTA